MRNAGNKGHPTEDLGNVGVWLEGYEQASGNASNFAAAAIGESASKVLAKTLFKEVPVALLEAQFVIMNNDKSIHVSIIMGCLRLGEQ